MHFKRSAKRLSMVFLRLWHAFFAYETIYIDCDGGSITTPTGVGSNNPTNNPLAGVGSNTTRAPRPPLAISTLLTLQQRRSRSVEINM
ncbi:hypothetical protein EDB82DRAFT_504289 [Fusarium venenatum]|uniref:uncharacterized protein n=1 Tax=Fusarium venenatum TaxID=56646 RepID=UPI001D96AB57|nr:hypothetical protein EDB82DRAFT_504289 [Fusarium venenatum]